MTVPKTVGTQGRQSKQVICIQHTFLPITFHLTCLNFMQHSVTLVLQ